MDTTKTGTYLATLRKNADMTQQEVAERLGISNKTVSKWESGGGFPDISLLPALAVLYGVSADELLAGESLPQARTAPSQVEHFLSQRQTLRFRIGYAVAALCLLAAMLFRYSPAAVQGLLIAAAAAALWIGWGSCSKQELSRRLSMLLPFAVVAVWLMAELVLATPLSVALTKGNAQFLSSLRHHLQRLLPWDITLILLPAVYVLLRGATKQWGESSHLLSRPYFWVLFSGWALYLIEEIIRFAMLYPKAVILLETSGTSYVNQKRSADFYSIWYAFYNIPWYIIGATSVALIVVALVQFNKKTKQ
ncbi:MAG: helix-turn-helix transcriptional regulator [Oscillospiraceae bacterium]|nr:helix-turn-helix transcriptional regulator [Oscillospiraceae bacterium]